LFGHRASRELANAAMAHTTPTSMGLSTPPLPMGGLQVVAFCLYGTFRRKQTTTPKSRAITLLSSSQPLHPRIARSCGSTHGIPTQWNPM
jgi:hypothetical protein